ncbi:MAG TPA: MFS transporter [Ktedonobacteraceae bacterium]
MTKSLWKQKNFMLLWSGQLVSWVGTEVTSIALPLVVLALTGSPTQAGKVAAIRGLVYVLWAIPAGALVDQWNIKIVMVISNLGSGLAMGGIAITLGLHVLKLPELYVACAIEGSFFVFTNLARFASLPRAVTKEQFPAASAQMGSANQAAILVGPALGGFLLQLTGGFATFLADAISYIVNAVSIFFISTSLNAETPAERRALHRDIQEAFAWYRKASVIRFLNLMTAGRIGVEAGLYLLIVVLAKEHHASSVAIGLIFTTAAIGGIAGSWVAPKVHSRYGLKQLLAGVSLLSLLVFCLYTLANSVYALGLITALYYAVDPLFHVTTSSYSAKVIPDTLRARVVSFTRLQVLAANSLGFFIVGQSLQYLGSRSTIYIFLGLLSVLLVLIVANSKLSPAEASAAV